MERTQKKQKQKWNKMYPFYDHETIGELIYAWKVGLSGETWIFIQVWTCKFEPDKNLRL